MWLRLPRIFRFEICHPFKTFIIRDIPSKNQDSPSIVVLHKNYPENKRKNKGQKNLIRSMSRHSSVVEQLIRNQQARGSTPRAGSSEIKGLADLGCPFFT